MVQIRVNLDRSKVDGVLKALYHAYSDFGPLLKDISKIQLKSADDTFKTRGVELGTPWAPLKSRTVREKMRVGKNIDILQRSGTMRRSFHLSKLTKNEINIENTIK